MAIQVLAPQAAGQSLNVHTRAASSGFYSWVHAHMKNLKEWGLVIGVLLMSVGANLPDDVSAFVGVDRRYLLGTLVVMVTVALVRHLEFALVLVVAILAIGANLPAQMAEDLNVRTDLMLFGLAAMVLTSFVNYVLKLPKGTKSVVQINSVHGARTLCHAALKGHASMVYSLISAGINPNFRDDQGHLPLVIAAEQGHALVVKLLLDNGADPAARDGDGNTPLAAARARGFTQTATLLMAAGATS